MNADVKQNIDRREFISRTARFAMAVSLPALVSCKHDPGSQPPVIPGCDTTADILGPFYLAGAPFQEDIIPAENTAPPLTILGKVFGDCDTPLKDAVLEVWNANGDGEYDNTAAFKFRGRYQTDETGEYRFKTIIPGRYLNGGVYRPSHVHFRITAPNHQELVSQIYFKDDPFIATDPWAGDPRAKRRILTIGKDDTGMDTVTFDIYLTKV